MRGIDEYLRLQDETNKEINLILQDLETVERKEKELLYLENKQLIDKLEVRNRSVAAITRNEFVSIRKRIGTLAIINETRELGLTFEMSNLFELVNSLESKLNNLEMKISRDPINEERSKVNTALPAREAIRNKTPLKKTAASGLKLGVGALNLIGIILILISLTTFGRYVYVNFMSKEMKGVVLFLVPTLILLASELYFSKKNYKFSKGITALGISGLYTAVIINYLVLNNITGLFALIITTIITGGAIYLSYRKESNLLRIVTLIGAYICLVPIDKISIEQSYILVVILTIIHVLNIYFPLQDIKNKDINIPFEFYTSILALVSTIIIGANLDKNVFVVLLIITTIVYSVQYVITCTSKDNLLNSVAVLLYFVIYPMVTTVVNWDLNTRYIPLSIFCIIGALIFFALKKTVRWTGYVGFVLSCLVIILNIAFDRNDSYIIALVLLTGVTLMLFLREKNNFLKYTLVGLIGVSMLGFLISIEEPIGAIYLVLFAAILYGSKEYKNEIGVVVFKYFNMLAIVGWVLNAIIHIEAFNHLESFLLLSICIIYTVVLNKVDRFKHDKIKEMNFVSLCLISLACIILGLFGATQFYLTTILIFYNLVFMFTKDYIDEKLLKFNKSIVYALLSTYIVVRLTFIIDIVYEVKQLILSVSLMVVALGSVFIGFKANNSKLRKYGLFLSLITCLKLMLVDFYSFDFIIKTLVFMVVGVIALIISYTFSKLENEYKNK